MIISSMMLLSSRLQLSQKECIARIHRVLSDRWTWLAAKNLDDATDMTVEQRVAFHKWALEEFAKDPDEQERNRLLREAGKTTSKVQKAVRCRFNLEKQRRAGSPQMWDILSYQGTISEVMLTRLFADLEAHRGEAQGSDPGRCDPDKKWAAQKAKDALRYARYLQRRIDQNRLERHACNRYERNLLEKFADGSLTATANHCVLEQGRGRLRGPDPDDYVDIGTNREFSFVTRVLDGPQRRPCTDRFRH